MNIGIITTHPLFQRHFAAELELAQLHLDAGDSVYLFRCGGELPACDVNNHHEPLHCALCKQSRKIGVQQLEKKNGALFDHSFLHLSDADKQEFSRLQTHFSSLAELRAYTIENFDIGLAVISSIISYVVNANFDVREHHDLVHRHIQAAFLMYRSTQNIIDKYGIERFYIFNGRMSASRGILRACESRNVHYFTHEFGHDDNSYSLFENNMPHSIGLNTRMMLELWNNNANNPERDAIAAHWYEQKARGAVVNGYSMTAEQERGMLPENWDATKRNIVLFNSSEFELAALSDEWQHHIYENQLDGVKKIVESLLSYKDIHVYLRIHPNLQNSPVEASSFLALQSPNLTVIAPTDKISSYSLLSFAEKVLVFSSTIGIEATYWEKPSILASRTVYQELDAVYRPQNHEEVIAYLLQKNLPPKSKEQALIYGYFWSALGIPFRYYAGKNFFAGTFKGVVPMANRWWFRLFTLYTKLVPSRARTVINNAYSRRHIQRFLR